MSTPDYGQRLLRYGFFLFGLGLLTGFMIPALHNPRMGLSAHLEGVMNGIFLVVLGLAWHRFVLPARARFALFGLALYGTYVNWATTVLAALFGTSRHTPIAGAGFAGWPWQEALVDFGLFSLSVAVVAACALALWGLRTPDPAAGGADGATRGTFRSTSETS